VSPLRRAISAAQTRPAIWAAIVAGEKPSWFSQRSCSLLGPCSTMKSAAARTWRQSFGRVRASWWASTIGSPTWSICVAVHFGRPSTCVFCGNEPSSSCCSSNAKSSAALAPSVSPAACRAVATW
jgi:hypothetical protein